MDLLDQIIQKMNVIRNPIMNIQMEVINIIFVVITVRRYLLMSLVNMYKRYYQFIKFIKAHVIQMILILNHLEIVL